MGKEWLLYWVGGTGGTSKSTKKRKSGVGGGGGSSTERESGSPPAGCMCSVFQLFDLHHFQFPLNHHQSTLKTDHHSFLHFQDHEPSSVTKGVETPRNSLELLETAASLSSSSSAIKEDEILNIPVGIQIRTSCDNRSPRASTSSSKARGEDVYSECGGSSSPGAKTPNLVARLMGLDLLPETVGSPSLSSSSSHRRSYITNPRHGLKPAGDGGSVSLPETPRISLARRSDVEQSRLSLQMNREHVVVVEDLEYSAKKKTGNSRRRDVRAIMQDENRSPGGKSYHARNIVQQVKERVSRSRNKNRKVGLDITNTLKSREQRKDDNLILLKPTKKTSPSVLTTGTEDHDSSNSKQTTPSCSPRIRLFLDPKNKAITSSTSPRLSPLSVSAEKQCKVQEEANIVLPQKVIIRPDPDDDDDDDDQQQQHMYKYKSVQKECKKAGNERFNSRLIRNKKEESFIRSPAANKLVLAVNTAVSEKKKCKKKTTPLSNELLPVTVTRKDTCLLPLTKLRDKQQVSDTLPCTTTTTSSTTRLLPSCASRSYYPEDNIRQKRMCNGAASISSSVDEMEFQYVKRILKRTGLDNATPVTLAKWFSPTHPLDPSIFHYMELFHPAATATKLSRPSQRSNRKLMFQLVDEILVEILKPYINPKPNPCGRGQRTVLYGSELIEEVCRRMKNFPSANCQVLEDIDALIGEDLRKSKTTSYVEEEEEVGERIALEIEREIMEALMHETSSTLLS